LRISPVFMNSQGPKVLKRPRRRPAADADWTYAAASVHSARTRSESVGGLWRTAFLVVLLPVLVMTGLRAYRQFPSLEAAKELVSAAVTRELDIPTDMSHAALIITTNPSQGVSIWVDGRPMGKTPLDRLVIDMGPHQIRAYHPLYGNQLQDIVATRSQELELTFDFEQ
jgi:hypothetical protein